jgi:hypothetical protein
MADNDALASCLPTRLRWRYGIPWKRRAQWLLVTAVVLAFAVGRGIVDHNLVLGAIVGSMVIGWLVADAVLERPGVRVTERRQPELFALVHEVAAFGGLRPPNRIWLTPGASIEAQGRIGRRELLVGWANLLSQSEAEIRALVARELMILQFRWPRIVARLSRRWSAAAILAAGPSPSKRAVRFEANLRPMAQLVLAAADVAATNAVGREVAARAFVVNSLQDLEFDDFAEATQRAPGRWWKSAGYFEDIYDVWPQWLANCEAMRLDGPGAERLLGMINLGHPGMTDLGRDLRSQRIELRPSGTPVHVAALTRGQVRLLIRRLRNLGLAFFRWYTYSTAPASWWSDRARAEAGTVRRGVTVVLGRPPVDAFEAAEVLITRNREMVAAWNITPDAADDDDLASDPSDYSPPPILCGVVEDALLHQGWHLEQPAIRGVLIGPRGERLDVLRSVTRTASGFDLEALRSALRPDASWVAAS